MHQDQDRHPLGKNVDGWNTLKPASHLHTRSPPTKKKMNWLYQEDLVLPCNLAMPNKYFFIYLSIILDQAWSMERVHISSTWDTI